MTTRNGRRFALPILQGTIAVAIAGTVLTLSSRPLGGAQATPPPAARPAEWAQRSRNFEQTGLAEPFKGITADGTVVPNLYAVRATGVSTAPVVTAANAFLGALSEPQRTKTLFAVDDPEWRKWMNQHFYIRQGVGFDEMSEAQRQAAFGLIKASLSAKGLTLTRDIMRLNHTLGELNNNDFVQYGEWFYWMTVMGTPSATQPWGWQLDGHHVIINYYVQGDQVVMTPTFIGSEPVTATTGKYAGTSVLQDQQNRGLAFVNSLDAAARAKAIVAPAKTSNNNRTEAFKDNVVMAYEGVKASELPASAQNALADLIGLYVGIMDDGHAKAEDGGGEAAPRRHAFLVGGRDHARRGLLLPHPQPGDPDRVRSPDADRHPLAGRVARTDAAAHPRRHADAERQRLRQGSAAPAPADAQALAAGRQGSGGEGGDGGDLRITFVSQSSATIEKPRAVQSSGPRSRPESTSRAPRA